MTARGLWFDPLGDYNTALSCKAFHIDDADPFFNYGSDYENLHRLPLRPRAQYPREIPTAKIHGAIKCDRYVADAVPLTIGDCGQPDNPQDHCGEQDRHPIHPVPRPRRTIDGPLLTPSMKQRCSTGPQYGRTAESQCSASSDPSLRLQGVALRDGSTNEKPPTPHAPAANNFKICNDFCRITAADEWECS